MLETLTSLLSVAILWVVIASAVAVAMRWAIKKAIEDYHDEKDAEEGSVEPHPANKIEVMER